MKYDIELLPAGTKFKLTFELWRPENEGKLVSITPNPARSLYEALIFCLHGLQDRRIHLGQRKRRGFGQCTVQDWRTWRFDMSSDKDLCTWLDFDPKVDSPHETVLPSVATFRDKRQRLFMSATFKLDSSMLIRAGDPVVDMVHLKSQRGSVPVPILPGTSVTGALRARALRIAQTVLSHQPNAAKDLVEGMFGSELQRHDDQPLGSRVLVKETDVKHVENDLVQSRVKIDRFTGGAYPGALFSQQPLFGRDATELEIQLELRKPNDFKKGITFEAEVGLLLLVLKDLWTSDLPLGGESSVGRGRLVGKEARLEILGKDYTLKQTNGRLLISDSSGRDEHELRNELENYVRKLQEVA
jgi:CRISPR/Cas system CSM-associated protein Csm3 (group 7 of RAMP superfamily)